MAAAAQATMAERTQLAGTKHPRSARFSGSGGQSPSARPTKAQEKGKSSTAEWAEASSSSEQGLAPPAKRPFLTSKFQVGSARSDRISFKLVQKVFHTSDVPAEVLAAKKVVNKSLNPNILCTEPQQWDQSTIADPMIEPPQKTDLKRTLLKVRAGLADQPSVNAKGHGEEELADLCRFIVAQTGKGPVGKLTGKWMNAVDERGLSAHMDPKWQDWKNSCSTTAPEDLKAQEALFQEREERRKKMNPVGTKLDAEAYMDPSSGIANLNLELQKKKVEYQDMKEQFKRELKVEFPNASEERLQAMGQRLLTEKLLADEKLKRFPVQHESFNPSLSLTSPDRRYKVHFHPGAWAWSEVEAQFCWSCCMNFSKESRGCNRKVVNPDSWCTLGFDLK